MRQASNVACLHQGTCAVQFPLNSSLWCKHICKLLTADIQTLPDHMFQKLLLHGNSDHCNEQCLCKGFSGRSHKTCKAALELTLTVLSNEALANVLVSFGLKITCMT